MAGGPAGPKESNDSVGREPGRVRAVVVHPELRGGASRPRRSAAARLEEAVGLALAIGLQMVHSEVLRIAKPRPATLLGKGAVETLEAVVAVERAALCIVDGALSPIQQRNLEWALNCKVIDRTGLILEIFGARARTKEGSLQVELAALSYQRSRLVRSWTHLERQRGGFGFLGGPGESQLEIDRRLTSERIARIKQDLEQVRRTRELHRRARRRVPYSVVALVGYTNAGKSTLFNRLTHAEVLAQDLLFATLDPTMRKVRLASGRDVILSDTVGFISDLPTGLVAAFRATLEEVCEADLVVHVRDVSHPDSEAQCQDVLRVLCDLGLGDTLESGVIEVLNKIDLLDEESRDVLLARSARRADQVPVSALTGEGIEELLALLGRRLAENRVVVELAVPSDDGAALAWLYDHGQVLSRRDDEHVVHLRVSLAADELARFERHHGRKRTAPA
jgi:GTP-binding protein HflX